MVIAHHDNGVRRSWLPYAAAILNFPGTSLIGAVLKNCWSPTKKAILCVSLFMRRGGTLQSQVPGCTKCSSDLQQGGLEMPCV